MFIIGVLLGAIIVVFVLQNVVPVSVVFLGWHVDGSLAVLILLAIIAGMVLSWLLALPEMLRISDLRTHNRRLQKDLDEHRQKLSETEGKLSQAEKPIVVEKTVFVDNNSSL